MSEPMFSTEMIIADIFEEWTQTTSVFFNFKMACVGCPLARFETLSAALAIYKIPADTFLTALQHAVQPQGDAVS